ncbi:MAG: hypothetical protein GYB33_11650 [Gammaproteobacteria bacterium]|uniref:hypothetical protein n=1 Tax=Pseudomaricurvus alcaniphilus TaxID=1166482 RepID=UPI00140E57D2|nr:hypothetical protein [Pseudomaricurvus alcaniphilus]MBR9910990.1 hypothetical protein [Gammaproteobacteria bacterium]NHN37700.1 hypothetical protein [Pseudomaricurvus alcaniphilus]
MPNTAKTAVLMLLLLLQGCTNALKVEGDFPIPLVKPTAHNIAVYYDDTFRTYTYTEESKDRGKWIIETGDAQIKLFNQVLSQLFGDLTVISALPEAEAPLAADLVIHPKIIEFQYSVPRETRFKVYEVWLKYNLSAYNSHGGLVADWILTGYGKTPTAFMLSDEKAMNAAAVVALRDLGANLSLTTLRVPEIRAWMENKSRILATVPASPASETVEPKP